MLEQNPRQHQRERILKYYKHPESKYGYKLFTWDTKHFGYYPDGEGDISEREAQFRSIDLLAEKLELKEGELVLDAGSGRGTTDIYLAEKYKVKVKGIDIVPFELKISREKAEDELEEPKTAEFIAADYSETPFADDSFSKIFTLETLVHSPDFKATLLEFHRLLKPGGRLVHFEYTTAPQEEFSPEEWRILKLITEGSAMMSLGDMKHGIFEQNLVEAGFTIISTTDISQNVLPSMRRFKKIAYFPYQLIKFLNIEKHLINTVAGVEFYELFKKGLVKYQITVATK